VAAVEYVFIMYNPDEGTEPSVNDINAILKAIGPAAGVTSFQGAKVSSYGYTAELSHDLALAVVARAEGKGAVTPGALERTRTYTLTAADGASIVVVLVGKN
jgi:hypothetical protein